MRVGLNLHNLKELNLGKNQINDIHVLANLPSLTILHLDENNIDDINVLSSLLEFLKDLTWLDISYNPIHLDDIIWLEEQFPNCEIRFEYDIEDSNDDESWLE